MSLSHYLTEALSHSLTDSLYHAFTNLINLIPIILNLRYLDKFSLDKFLWVKSYFIFTHISYFISLFLIFNDTFLIKYRDLKTLFTSTSLEIPLSTTSFEPSPMYISFPKSCKVNGGSSFSSTSSPTSSMPVYAYSSNSVNSLSSVELQNYSKQSINSSGLPSPKRAIQKLKMKKK
jgi:hypothetical protein